MIKVVLKLSPTITRSSVFLSHAKGKFSGNSIQKHLTQRVQVPFLCALAKTRMPFFRHNEWIQIPHVFAKRNSLACSLSFIERWRVG